MTPTPSRWTLRALWALPVALIAALLIGPILRDGMFIDGLVYTNIAKNLYQGMGSLWAPTVDGGGSIFYGHPVLLPFLESGFFHLLGNHLYTEDAYNFTVLALTILLLYFLWRETAGASRSYLFFFPLLLFVLNQEVQLRYPNTMLECGMTLFLLLFTYLFLRLRPARPRLASAAAGLGAFVAFLCKGPVGLFLLVLPVAHRWATARRINPADVLLPALTLGISFAFLFLAVPEAQDFVLTYLDHQVGPALAGRATENVAESRFAILLHVLNANLPGLLVCLLLLFVPREAADHRRRALAAVFLLVGAAALLPIMVSTKQATYYQLPSVPFFVLGASLLLTDRVAVLVRRIGERPRLVAGLGAVTFAGLIAAVGVAISMYGTTDRRDQRAWTQAAAISAAMDSLGTQRYALRVYGAPAGGSSPLSYTLTGTLNRRYDIYADRGSEPAVRLEFAYDWAGVPEPPAGRVVYTDGQVRLVALPPHGGIAPSE
ncbi:hypothetical protein [Lewinella sp. IMCC34183]|uniref:hypothetical protein n=1 Tax=Lewinella sp. IMCC34183 TaxID=2248762 RepID=UPI000E260776|nr:hypothetical protein [Lewinella sp. IMCC34183]